MIDILRLDEGLQVVLKHFREVVLKFGSTEVLQDFLPIGGILSRVSMQFGERLSVARTS